MTLFHKRNFTKDRCDSNPLQINTNLIPGRILEHGNKGKTCFKKLDRNT